MAHGKDMSYGMSKDKSYGMNKGKYGEADKVAGKHYGYPKSCMGRFIKEKSAEFLKKNYSYWDYYKKQQDLDRKFPFVFHRPCSLKCRESLRMNERYRRKAKNRSLGHRCL